jgi:hypothetical protein
LGFNAGPVPAALGGMGIHAQKVLTPSPLPQAAPYGGVASRGPVEPWQRTLRLMMIVWGAAIVVVFMTPLATDPVRFNFTGIGSFPTAMLIVTLQIVAVGVLAIVIGLLPLATLPRGVLSALLGVSGIVVPFAVVAFPGWQILLGVIGLLILFSGLLVRNEYTESIVGRVMVTVGVVCVLVPYLAPVGSEIPLVQVFKGLLELRGKAKVGPALEIGLIALFVLSLLVWVPGPGTGGAKLFAWAILLWGTAIQSLVKLVVSGDIGGVIKNSPNAVVEWGIEAAFVVLIGYGVATVVGKQLE